MQPLTEKKKLVMVSGGFDPVHIGHVRMFEAARKLGDELLVVINCDRWLVKKKGKNFMSSNDRAELIKAFRCVDQVYVLESDNMDVSEAIELFKPAIFANGGDRREEKDIPEAAACKKYGVEMVFNVGGDKLRSSSELLKNYVLDKK
jgi:D-beta-D-heptose 7-phosphate kinase/D-beta-D-heptose 1-phosphate adenosyltransferase